MKINASCIVIGKMSQATALEFLKKNKRKWFTCPEISIAIGIRSANCYVNLIRLARANCIERILVPISSLKKKWLYRYKK